MCVRMKVRADQCGSAMQCGAMQCGVMQCSAVRCGVQCGYYLLLTCGGELVVKSGLDKAVSKPIESETPPLPQSRPY